MLAINGALSNQGTLSVQSVKLTVQNPTNLSANVLTDGTWQVSGGGKLVLPGPITTNAANIALSGPASIITTSNGTTNALGGLTAISQSGSLTLSGGQVLTVTPSGGTFPNDGTITVGAGSELAISGAFVQDSDGTFVVQIGGATSANFGQVVATGNVLARGTLQGSFVNAYDPPVEQTFAVLIGASESNSFTTVVGVTPSGRMLTAHYNSTSADCRCAACPLDTGADGGKRQRHQPDRRDYQRQHADLYWNGSGCGNCSTLCRWHLCRLGDGRGRRHRVIPTLTVPDGHHAITAVLFDSLNDFSPIASGPSIQIDTVAPTIHATINSPAASGWYNIASGVGDVHYVASDNTGGSGLASSVPPDHVFSDGANQSLAGVTISDIAGNTATSESFSGIKQDTVAPTIHATINAPAASGWYNIASGPAVVHYVASDNAGGSGLASSVPSDHLFADGSNQSLAGVTIADIAGTLPPPNHSAGSSRTRLFRRAPWPHCRPRRPVPSR